MTGAAEKEPRTLFGGARKSAARLAAVQALYQIDHSSSTSDSVHEQFLRYRLGDSFGVDGEVRPNKNLFSEIVRGVAGRQKDIDAIISGFLTEKWSFDRLEFILRAILRAGVYELKARKNTPARVVITEYVDVAHAFYSDQEPGLVNGLLDRIAHTLRPGEFVDGSGED